MCLKNQTRKGSVSQKDPSSCKTTQNRPESERGPDSRTFLNPSLQFLQADGIPELQNETDTHAVRDPMPCFPEPLQLTARCRRCNTGF